jgi:hypothetical protein
MGSPEEKNGGLYLEIPERSANPVHTILEYCDIEYQLTYSMFPVRVSFFEALRVLIRRRYFASWLEFLQYVRG